MRTHRTSTRAPSFGSRVALALTSALLLSAGCKTRLLTLNDRDVEDAGALFDLNTSGKNCGVQNFPTTARATPDLLILQDRSGSMNNGVEDNRNPPPGQSKWDLIRAALEEVVTTPGNVDWGLMMFGSDRMCGAPTVPEVAVGPDTGATIKMVLDATTPQSQTPTTTTLNNAVAYYQSLSDGHPHYLMLATDGEPNCGTNGGRMGRGDDAPAAEAAVANAAAAGIDTFVVGIGGNTGADQALAVMAMNGNQPNTTPGERPYFAVSSTQDLVNVLQGIAGRIGTCSYPLDKVPEEPDLVTIEGSDGTIPRDTSHVLGWDYGPNFKSVIFYGAACAQLQSGVLINLQAIYQCPPSD